MTGGTGAARGVSLCAGLAREKDTGGELAVMSSSVMSSSMMFMTGFDGGTGAARGVSHAGLAGESDTGETVGAGAAVA